MGNGCRISPPPLGRVTEHACPEICRHCIYLARELSVYSHFIWWIIGILEPRCSLEDISAGGVAEMFYLRSPTLLVSYTQHGLHFPAWCWWSFLFPFRSCAHTTWFSLGFGWTRIADRSFYGTQRRTCLSADEPNMAHPVCSPFHTCEGAGLGQWLWTFGGGK